MKKVFGILFIIVGIVGLPNVIAPTATETIGRLIGWSLGSVIPAYFLLRNGSKKDKGSESDNNK